MYIGLESSYSQDLNFQVAIISSYYLCCVAFDELAFSTLQYGKLSLFFGVEEGEIKWRENEKKNPSLI